MPSNINQDTAHFVGQASVFAVGANLVTNGDFAADSGWTKGTGWTTAGGDADCDGTAVADTELLSDTEITTVAGTVYRVQFNCTARPGGEVTAAFDGTELGNITGIGIKTGYIAATDASSSISIIGDEDFVGSVDDVSVVAWVGDLNAGGGITIAALKTLLDAGGDLTAIMTATGGVLHNESGLALADDDGSLQITAGSTWDKTPIVGTLVNCDFSATFADGIYEIILATSTTITIDLSSGGLGAETVEVWIGGAYPDIATAINDSTLSEDPDGTYRKRYICVNVNQEVDAATVFVAETSETALREDDGSRKIIGFYDSISVVTAHSSYRVVSDIDEGQTYYSGARKAFNSVENFPVINPDGKWIEWNAKGNAINILELNTSNFEMRNFKVHNTVTGAAEGLLHVDTANFNTTLINCWFAASSRFQVDDLIGSANSAVDCYFDTTLENVSLTDWRTSHFLKCIFNGTDRTNTVEGVRDCWFAFCTVYKGAKGLLAAQGVFVVNCTFISQTQSCVEGASQSAVVGLFYNNIFSPVAVSDVAIKFGNKGSLSPAGFNNIMFCVAAGAVLTNPITHGEITPNSPLPIGTLEVDPQFVNFAQGDYRLRASSPALNGGIRSLSDGRSTIGAWQPYALPVIRRVPRPRYGGSPIYK